MRKNSTGEQVRLSWIITYHLPSVYDKLDKQWTAFLANTAFFSVKLETLRIESK